METIHRKLGNFEFKRKWKTPPYAWLNSGLLEPLSLLYQTVDIHHTPWLHYH
jgi:hypothetical protein